MWYIFGLSDKNGMIYDIAGQDCYGTGHNTIISVKKQI